MNDDIGAPIGNRSRQVGRRECIIDDQRNTSFRSNLLQVLQGRNLEGRIGDGFTENRLCLAGTCALGNRTASHSACRRDNTYAPWNVDDVVLEYNASFFLQNPRHFPQRCWCLGRSAEMNDSASKNNMEKNLLVERNSVFIQSFAIISDKIILICYKIKLTTDDNK